MRSGNGWRGACLGGRAGPGAGEGGCKIVPDDLPGWAFDGDRSHLGRVDRCSSLQHAAGRTAAIMGAMPGLVGLTRRRAATAVADHGRGKWIGGCNGGRPARPDRCKNLHRQGDQDYGQKILQPSAHGKPIRGTTNHPPGALSRPGGRLCSACRSEINGRPWCSARPPHPFLPWNGPFRRTATRTGKIPIISQIARNLNNRCRK